MALPSLKVFNQKTELRRMGRADLDRLGFPAEKYFCEVPGHSSYDLRYFNGTLTPAAVRVRLRKLLVAFSDLCRCQGLSFFLVHGTLLGWYWGRHILPWDDDIDISVALETIQELEKLNGCVSGAEYLLDVNPYWRERRTANRTSADHAELNKIDARFIDCSSGLFLDITGLARSGGLLVSKCPHVYRYEEIYPLRKEYFEDIPVNIPARPDVLLKREYGGQCLTKKQYNGYEWNPEAAVWQHLGLDAACSAITARLQKEKVPESYEICERYRRTVACHPRGKRLYQVTDVDQAPIDFGTRAGDLCPAVIFFKLRSRSDGQFYWAKSYQDESRDQLILELLLYRALALVDFPVVMPVAYDKRYGLVFRYDDELFHGVAVHVYHATEFFSPAELQTIRAFANHLLDHPVFGRKTVAELADFQTVRTRQGLRFIDFMLWPRHWLGEYVYSRRGEHDLGTRPEDG